MWYCSRPCELYRTAAALCYTRTTHKHTATAPPPARHTAHDICTIATFPIHPGIWRPPGLSPSSQRSVTHTYSPQGPTAHPLSHTVHNTQHIHSTKEDTHKARGEARAASLRDGEAMNIAGWGGDGRGSLPRHLV